MGFLDKLQSKLEIYRLEQKYTHRKNRTTFTTGAQYVDGEYVYSDQPISASSTGSSSREGNKRRSMMWMAPKN